MESALGPGYDYWKNIKSPSEMGMSPAGTMSALNNDVNGIISYASLLIDGNSNASKTGEPLGNRFLLKTMAKCRNVESDRTKPESEKNPIYVPRYIYVDNVPDGTIPFISSGPDGGKMKDFRGLIPGAIGNLAAFRPSGFFRAFTMGNYPDCIKITLRTKDNNNNDGVQTEYVAVADILNEISTDNMPNGNPVNRVTDPCKFKGYEHPITKQKKTKNECEPASEDFSVLLHSNTNTKQPNDDDSSDDDGRITKKNESETLEQKKEKAALKQMRKMRRKEKKMQQSQYQYPHHDTTTSNTDKTVTYADDFESKYDTMRFKNIELDQDQLTKKSVDAAHAYTFPDDIISKLYYAAISGVGLYILYKLLYTTRKKKV
jgi:hypothetical protein